MTQYSPGCPAEPEWELTVPPMCIPGTCALRGNLEEGEGGEEGEGPPESPLPQSGTKHPQRSHEDGEEGSSAGLSKGGWRGR